MAWQELRPNIVGSGQPFSGELTEVAIAPLDTNVYCDIFISNVSTTNSTKVRLAIKNYYEALDSRHYILYDTEVVAQGMLIIPRIGLQSETQVLGYSDNGLAAFNVTGNTIINYA